MTFKEKLQKEHPDKVGPEFRGGCFMCPVTYGYEDRDDRPCRNNSRTNCTECWNRVIPGTEESKTFNFKPEGLNALIERAATKRDISVSIFITGDSTHISVYPCPDPSEKQGNPVAEAYRLLVQRNLSGDEYELALKKLEEALE